MGILQSSPRSFLGKGREASANRILTSNNLILVGAHSNIKKKNGFISNKQKKKKKMQKVS